MMTENDKVRHFTVTPVSFSCFTLVYAYHYNLNNLPSRGWVPNPGRAPSEVWTGYLPMLTVTPQPKRKPQHHKVFVYILSSIIRSYFNTKNVKLYTIFLHLDSLLAPNPQWGELIALFHTPCCWNYSLNICDISKKIIRTLISILSKYTW